MNEQLRKLNDEGSYMIETPINSRKKKTDFIFETTYTVKNYDHTTDNLISQARVLKRGTFAQRSAKSLNQINVAFDRLRLLQSCAYMTTRPWKYSAFV